MSTATPLPAYRDYEHLLISGPAPGVAHVEINRAKKLNAFSKPMWIELRRAFEQLSADVDVRATILSGAGDRAFTAGLDVQSAVKDGMFPQQDLDASRKAKPLRSGIEEFQACISSIEKCEKPVICAMHGVAFGLAIDIACCADLRFSSADARFAVKEVDIGMPADIGTLARLPKIVGSHSWVKDVCMTARDFSAEEAQKQGFVSNVYADKASMIEASVKLASLMAEKSPIAVQGTKELINHGRDHPTVDALRYTAVWNSVVVQSEDMAKGLTSALQKKKPEYAKL